MPPAIKKRKKKNWKWNAYNNCLLEKPRETKIKMDSSYKSIYHDFSTTLGVSE